MKECRRKGCGKLVDQSANIRKYGRNHGTTKYGYCSIACYRVDIIKQKKNK